MKSLFPGITCLSLLLFSLMISAAEDTTQVTNAYRGVMQDRNSHNDAEALFVEKCSMCHRQMGMGTVLLARRLGPQQAMLEQRDNLTQPLIEFAVRNGLGNMPRISRSEVSDDQLDTIIGWLTQHKAKKE